MSTNSECAFIEVKPNEWWYVLEDIHAPQNSWDWREHAQATGPFKTNEEARKHLHRFHANPGSYYDEEYVEGYEPDAVMKKLMETFTQGRKEFPNFPIHRF
jgi:hypothetical protein